MAQIAVVLGAVAATRSSSLAMDPNWAQAFTNARRIVSLEQVLGVAWEQSLQRAFLALPDLVSALNVFYFVGHFLFTAIFFFWLYHRSREGSELPRRLSRGNRDRARDPLALSDRAAAARRGRHRRHAAGSVRDRHRLADVVGAVEPRRRCAVSPRGYALGVGIGLIRFAGSHLVRAAGRRLPAARRAHDRRHGQPFRARRRRRDGGARRGFRLARALRAGPKRRYEPALPDPRLA